MFSFKRDKGRKEFTQGVECYRQQRYTKAESLLRQSTEQREKVLGAEHVDTLDSKYHLACTLYRQQKYAEAEQLLRQSAGQREKVFGADHKDTLASKELLQKVVLAKAPAPLVQEDEHRRMEYELRQSLGDEQDYVKVERQFRWLVRRQENVLGAEDRNTLWSKYHLALALLHSPEKYAEAERLLRQSAQQLGNVLGTEDRSTLRSVYNLALTLYHQKKYIEAEQLLRQSIQQQEKALGDKDRDTLQSRYWLAVTLDRQQKYLEAEHILRQLVLPQEKMLIAEDRHTLWNRYNSALTLHRQEKYTEAEQLLRQSIQQQGVLSAKNRDTLRSRFQLVAKLYSYQKYPEAEQFLRQLVQQQERMLGAENHDTFESRYALAVTLYNQQKYTEAEQLLRQSAQQREKILGAGNRKTLQSIFRLAAVLCSQQNYAEAEQLLQQLGQQQEKFLGVDHQDTLASKELLRRATLREAHPVPTVTPADTRQREKVLGANHKDTLARKELLRKVVLAQVPPAPTNALAEVVFSRLSDFFTDGSQRQIAYTDSEIQQVSLLLIQVNLQWSKVPRTYMVLRIVGCLDHLDTFIDAGVSDHWLPFTERSLPPCIRPGKRSQFVGAQNLVMTKSMDLEKGKGGQHCYFRQDEPLPFEMKGILGSGGYGQVDRVLSTISFREYALKRVSRSSVFSGRTEEDIRRRAECVKQFIAEIGALKRLKHHHVVEFVGSYTDPKYMGLIMSPVADMDLSAYLARADSARYRELRTFFGCLARALAFLHEQSIRHKDIKPSNILVHGGNVLFTDFGLAFDFTDKTGSTTAGTVNGKTLKYCAPEVVNEEPRNTWSDIWSLGVVFLEITAVLKGRTVAYMYDFLKEHGSGLAFVRTNPAGTDALVAELKEVGSPTDNAALGWVQDMVTLPQQLRPTAASLITSITSAGQKGGGNEAFCGICCTSPDDLLSDVDELEIADAR
jgi:serine/threonine protein kinase/TolA-binding protein